MGGANNGVPPAIGSQVPQQGLGQPAVPIASAGNIDGLHIANDQVTPDAIVDIDPGQAVADDGAFLIVSPGTLSPDITAAPGANSIDAGVVGALLWYAVWLIGDSNLVNATAALFSLSFTQAGIVFPAGYNRARRVGAIATDATADILVFDMPKAPSRARWVYWKERQVIQGSGTATSYTDTAVSAALRVPPPATRQQIGMLALKIGGMSSLAGAEVIPDGWNEAAGNEIWRVGAGLNSAQDPASTGVFEMPVGPTREVRYLVSPAGDAAATIRVEGWEDAL